GAGPTNAVLAELHFGTNIQDKVYARRAGENSVYAVRQDDVARLPRASWQMRDLQIWNVSTNGISGVTIRQQGRVRQIIRRGPYSGALAPGSQGIIDDLAVEETVRGFTRLQAGAWAGHGDQIRNRYGMSTNAHSITLELKNGENLTVELGAE